MAKLTKNPSPRIVRYHAAWLEEEYRTRSGSGTGLDKTRQRDNNRLPSSSESSSSSSEEENLENIDEDSNAFIIFESSQDTQETSSNVQYVQPSVTSQLSSSSRETVTKHAFYLYSKEEEIVSKGKYSSAVVERSSRKVFEHKGVMSKQEIAGALSLGHPRRRHSSKPMTKYVLYIQMELCGKTLSTWLNTRNNNFQESGKNCLLLLSANSPYPFLPLPPHFGEIITLKIWNVLVRGVFRGNYHVGINCLVGMDWVETPGGDSYPGEFKGVV